MAIGEIMFGFDDKKKRILTISFFVYAIVLLLAIIMMNFEKFSTFIDWINDKLSVFTPIILGAIIAYLCTPLVRLYQKLLKKLKMKRNPTIRGLSILFAYVTLLGFVVIFVFLFGPQLVSSIEDLMRKMTDGTFMNSTLDKVNEYLNRILSSGNGEEFEFIDVDKINNAISKFFISSEDILQQGIGLIVSYAEKIFVGIKNIFLGILLSIYFVISKERLNAQSKKILSAALSSKKYESTLKWFRFADNTFGGFIVGKLLDALFMMVSCGIVFSLLKIPYAILVAVIIGVSNLIPFFGPFIGAIPSGLIILIANPGKFILFVITLLIIQQFDANVIEPKIVGTRTGLSSLGVIVAIMIMSGYFGLIGMFFGVPIFAIVCTIFMSAVDKKLEKKALTTDLASYYSEQSIVDPNRHVESIGSRLFAQIGNKFTAFKNSVGKKSYKKKQKKSVESENLDELKDLDSLENIEDIEDLECLDISDDTSNDIDVPNDSEE